MTLSGSTCDICRPALRQTLTYYLTFYPRGEIPLPRPSKMPVPWLLPALLLLSPGGCGRETDRVVAPEREAPPPELAELSSRLEAAARAGSLAAGEGRALAEELGGLFGDPGTLCDGCTGEAGTVEDGVGGAFSYAVRGPGGEPIADLRLFYRPALSVEELDGWAQRSLDGRPAASFEGEHLFVWAGRFEVRAFARSDAVRGPDGLERVLGLVPLATLERL